MSAATFSVRTTRGALSGQFRGVVEGEIFQADILIGRFRRGAIRAGFVPPLSFRFFSDRARDRFDAFADSSSIAETIEALAE